VKYTTLRHGTRVLTRSRAMAILNESIVEDAAIECFGELGYVFGHGRHLAPGELAAERGWFGEMVLVERLGDGIRHLKPVFSLACAPNCCQN